MNPNTVSSEGSYTIVLKTNYMGQTTTEEYEVNDTIMDGTWTLNGKTLTVTSDLGGTQSATILEQTSTTLKFKAEVSESESDQGVTVSTKIEAIYTFTKQ